MSAARETGCSFCRCKTRKIHRQTGRQQISQLSSIGAPMPCHAACHSQVVCYSVRSRYLYTHNIVCVYDISLLHETVTLLGDCLNYVQKCEVLNPPARILASRPMS